MFTQQVDLSKSDASDAASKHQQTRRATAPSLAVTDNGESSLSTAANKEQQAKNHAPYQSNSSSSSKLSASSDRFGDANSTGASTPVDVRASADGVRRVTSATKVGATRTGLSSSRRTASSSDVVGEQQQQSQQKLSSHSNQRQSTQQFSDMTQPPANIRSNTNQKDELGANNHAAGIYRTKTIAQNMNTAHQHHHNHMQSHLNGQASTSQTTMTPDSKQVPTSSRAQLAQTHTGLEGNGSETTNGVDAKTTNKSAAPIKQQPTALNHHHHLNDQRAFLNMMSQLARTNVASNGTNGHKDRASSLSAQAPTHRHTTHKSTSSLQSEYQSPMGSQQALAHQLPRPRQQTQPPHHHHPHLPVQQAHQRLLPAECDICEMCTSSARIPGQPQSNRATTTSSVVAHQTVSSSSNTNDLESSIHRDAELEPLLLPYERDLPIEISFLVRQQAFCMARINHLDKQIRELREARHQQVSTSSHACNHLHQQQQHNHQQAEHHNQVHATSAGATAGASNKTGANFIPSDDSGGEYSRATASDDDELSSLLDHIAKSFKTDNMRNNNNINNNNIAQASPASNHIHVLNNNANIQPLSSGGGNVGDIALSNLGNLSTLQYQKQLMNQATSGSFCNFMANQQQQYAIVNPNYINHLHNPSAAALAATTSHQHNHMQPTMPLLFMGAPMTMATANSAAQPSSHSINSTIVPGVHYQPEPRYNQYYEDLYVQNTGLAANNSTPRHLSHMKAAAAAAAASNSMLSSGYMPQPNRVSLVEHLIRQREKRQVEAQLKSADNWLKSRSSGSSMNNANSNNVCQNGASSDAGATQFSSANNIAQAGVAASVNPNANSEDDSNNQSSCVASERLNGSNTKSASPKASLATSTSASSKPIRSTTTASD